MTPDAVVIGTGIIGSFTALALHERGLRVMVIDRAGLAPGTSRSSDGNLLCSDKPPGLMLELSRRSLSLWRRFEARYGNDCEYDPKGATVVARSVDQAPALARFVAEQQAAGVECEFIESGWQRLEPELAADTAAVGYWPGDAQVQPMLACYQIARHLRAEGVDYRFYDAVETLRATPERVRITLASGEQIETGQLCVCAGVWTNEVLAPLGRRVPVRPRKGHICVLERGDVPVNSKIADFGYNAIAESTDTDEAAVQTAAIIESTRSGTILCGSSREFSGFDAGISGETLRRIMADCIAVVPALARLRVIRGYAGLRPFSEDGLPVIGPLPGLPSVLVATGHEGAGHGLAAVTGELVAEHVLDPTARPWDGALLPERFVS